MNGSCETCKRDKECAYEYKPCDCCNYRKFKPIPEPVDVGGGTWDGDKGGDYGGCAA